VLHAASASEVTTEALHKCDYYYYYLTPVVNSLGMKKLRYAIQKKYKNQAGMNLTPPPPSQKSCSQMAL